MSSSTFPDETASPDVTSVFLTEKKHLQSIAYSILGSLSDAEEVVQETWLRIGQSRGESLQNPAAWLTTVASRLALDRLRQASRHRETYPGIWLPEPVVEELDAEQRAIQDDRLSLAFLHLLETLTPEERAAYVLHEVFERSHREIAQVIRKTAIASRQLVSRARKKLAQHEAPPPEARSNATIERFLNALSQDDEREVLAVLAPDVICYGDGGGKAPTVINPILGADRVKRLLLGIQAKHAGQIHYRTISVNGGLGVFIERYPGPLRSVMGFKVKNGQITGVYYISNPDKLRGLESLGLAAVR